MQEPLPVEYGLRAWDTYSTCWKLSSARGLIADQQILKDATNVGHNGAWAVIPR